MDTTYPAGIYDESGRYISPPAVQFAERPMGPWDSNALITVCAWCPDFERTDQRENITHGICPACVAKMTHDEEPARRRARS